MSLTYLIDAELARSLGTEEIQSDLGAWLGEAGASLESGSYGGLRVMWADRSGEGGCWEARLVVSDFLKNEEITILISWQPAGGAFRFERQTQKALGQRSSSLEPAPGFLMAWLPQSRTAAPEFAESDGRLQLPCIEVASPETPGPDLIRLASEIERFTRGMASVQFASPSTIEQIAEGSQLHCDGRPGSVVSVSYLGDSPKVMVIPATVAMRSPSSAARRALQYLVSSVDLRLSQTWSELDHRLTTTWGSDDINLTLAGIAQSEKSWQIERLTLQTEIQNLSSEGVDNIVERAQDAEDIDGLRSQVRVLQRELARVNAYPSAPPEMDEIDFYPDCCVDLIELARDTLPGLLLTANQSGAALLDEHAKSILWARKIWTMLRGLNDYATIVTSGGFTGGLAQYSRNPPPGVLPLPWGKLALNESEATMNNPECVRARVFSVPLSVEPTRQAVMFAHLKVDRVSPAPRVHFLDKVDLVGKVIVGYVGPHLPTAG
jgi:hypothetical protein